MIPKNGEREGQQLCTCGENGLDDLIGTLSRASGTMESPRNMRNRILVRSHVTSVTHSKRSWPETKTTITVVRAFHPTSHPPPSESVTLRVPGGHARQSEELLEPAARVVDPCGQVTHAAEEVEPVVDTSSERTKHGRYHRETRTALSRRGNARPLL